MELNLRLDLAQQQSLHLTTELQQGLTILQLNATDLAEYLCMCLEENPVLIDVSTRDDPLRCSSVRSDETISDTPSGTDSSSTADANRTVYAGIDRRVSRLSIDALMEGRGSGSPATFDSERRDMSQRVFSIDRYLATSESLSEHIMSQLRLLTADERVRSIGYFIANSLDSSGYLTVSVGEAAEILGVSAGDVEHALSIVQRLDPPGIAARDLAECLRLQLDAEGRMTPTLESLLDAHLGDIAKKSVASVARDMRVSADELNEALAEIRSCNPRPGTQYQTEDDAVWPEIIVERMGQGLYDVRLQDVFLPDLRVDQEYRTLAEDARDKEASSYIKSKIREAEGLIEGVAYRNATLYKVACCVVELQSEFFDEGISRLRPLTMSQVAEKVGVSPSTVSRLANGNYMQTPRGTFELRFFFHGAVQSESSVEVSSKSVKRRMREIIEAENPSKPLSDQAIAEALRLDGVEISRRTVAKYRGQLGIPVRAARMGKSN